jgi:hypothetical protein
MSQAAPFANCFVHTKKTPYMQRISDLVRSGHTQYVLGQVLLRKAGYLAGKFSEILNVNEHKVAACRTRQQGRSTSRLLFLQSSDPDVLHWILLHRPGKEPDRVGQNWRDAITDRIVLTGYELVRHTRPGAHQPAWTWRYTTARFDELRESIIRSIRAKDDKELMRLLALVARSPGFAQVRVQVKKLQHAARMEWKRIRRMSEPMPEIPKHGYVRRIGDVGARLEELLVGGRAERRSSPALHPGPRTASSPLRREYGA